MSRAIGGKGRKEEEEEEEEEEKKRRKLDFSNEDTSFEMGQCLGCFSSVEVLYYFIVKVMVFLFLMNFFNLVHI